MSRPFLTAEWRHLLMLNYPVDPDVLAGLVPVGTTLDRWQGRCYVSIVGFMFLNTKLLGVPIPFHRHFPELNLRFYVTREEAGELRRGVVFVKEVVNKLAVATVAKWVYNENYVCASMATTTTVPTGNRPGRFEYHWRGDSQWYSVSANVTGQPQPLVPGSEAEFITEHYWGYAKQRDGGTVEYRVDHPPWRVWDAKVPHLDASDFYGPQFVGCLSGPPSSAFVADGSAVSVFRGRRL